MTIPWALALTGGVLLVAALIAAIAKEESRAWDTDRAWGIAATVALALGICFIIAGIWTGVGL